MTYYESCRNNIYEYNRRLIYNNKGTLIIARKSRIADNTEGDVDMTPMLDIILILLIFFIVTTSFVREEGLFVNKPKANNTPSSNKPVVVVKISENGQVSFNGKLVDIEKLPARIENFIATSSTNSAIVIADHDTNHKHVVGVIDKIKAFEDITVSIGK